MRSAGDDLSSACHIYLNIRPRGENVPQHNEEDVRKQLIRRPRQDALE